MTHDRRNPTWKIVAISAVSALGVLSWWGYTDTQAKINNIIATKAEKDTVDRMYDEIKDINKMMISHIEATGQGRITRRKETEWEP